MENSGSNGTRCFFMCQLGMFTCQLRLVPNFFFKKARRQTSGGNFGVEIVLILCAFFLFYVPKPHIYVHNPHKDLTKRILRHWDFLFLGDNLPFRYYKFPFSGLLAHYVPLSFVYLPILQYTCHFSIIRAKSTYLRAKRHQLAYEPIQKEPYLFFKGIY